MAQSVGAVALDIVMGKNTVSDAVNRAANDAKKSFGGMSDNVSTVNKALKETQGDLSEVDRLLKIDPRNTVLLEQKQRMLNSAISDTRSKMSELQSAAEQANMALENGDITQSKYDALQREIIETEQDLKSLEAQAKRTSPEMLKIAQTSEDFKNFGDKVSAAGDSVSAVGKKMLPASVAVSALGTGIVKTSADFDSAMSQVSSISGATGKDFDLLRDKAIEMGSKTKFSASESAEAMNYMAMAGWKTEDMLNGIDGIMNLAAASGEDLATTSDIVTDALTAFGMSASDSGHFADVLAAASSNANTNVSMMGETFKYVAPVAGAMGYNVEDMSVAIGLMANSGIKGSQAGTALRSTITRLAKPTEESQKAMDALGISITNQDGTMKSFNEIMIDMRSSFAGLTAEEQALRAAQLGGQEAMSGLLAIVNSSDDDFNKLTNAINNADGTAESMANTMNDNLNGQITLLKSQIEGLAIQLGEYLVPIVSQVVDAISQLATWFGNLDEGTKKTIVTIGLVVAAAAPVLIIVGKVIRGIGGAISVIGAIIGAIGGFIGFITGSVVPALSGFFAFIAANPIVLAIGAIVAAGAVLIANWDSVKEAAGIIWDGVTQAWDGLCQATSEAWENVKQWTSEAWQNVKQSASDAWENVKQGTSEAWENVKQKTSEAWENVKSTVSEKVNSVKSTVSEKWNNLKTDTSNSWNNIKTTISNSSGNARTGAVNAFNYMKNSIKNTVGGIKEEIVNGFEKAVSYITGLPEKALKWGKDLVQGIINGIKSMFSDIASAASDLAGKIAEYLHFSCPDVGPLSTYEEWMPDFVGGMANGIEKNKYKLIDAVQGMAGDMVLPTMSAPVLRNVGTYQQNIPVNNSSDDRLYNLLVSLMEKIDTPKNITVPVYLGNDLLDEQIIKAEDRRTVRSGGRS